MPADAGWRATPGGGRRVTRRSHSEAGPLATGSPQCPRATSVNPGVGAAATVEAQNTSSTGGQS